MDGLFSLGPTPSSYGSIPFPKFNKCNIVLPTFCHQHLLAVSYDELKVYDNYLFLIFLGVGFPVSYFS